MQVISVTSRIAEIRAELEIVVAAIHRLGEISELGDAIRHFQDPFGLSGVDAAIWHLYRTSVELTESLRREERRVMRENVHG